MAAPVSGNALAKILGVSEKAVRNAARANRIKRLPSGLFDPDEAREQWSGSTDPARSRVRTTPRTSAKVRTRGPNLDEPIRTPEQALDAVSLIARILAEEGVPDNGKGIDFGKTRTAEMILKARQRALDQDVQSGKLVDRAKAEKLFFDEARNLRDAWLAWPARIAITMADRLSVDARLLTAVLTEFVKQHLTELGEPDEPDWKPAR